MHTKRHIIPKLWPIPRKGTKFLITCSHAKTKSLPLLIILRDILKTGKNRKEVRKILNSSNVFVNNKKITRENFPLMLFDILHIKPDKYYKLVLKNKKFELKNVDEKEAETKLCKVVSKKILKGGEIQINLNDGRNLISKEKIKVNDTLEINLKNNKFKIIPFKENIDVFIIVGKNLGKTGKIEKIERNSSVIELDGKKLRIPNRNFMVI